MRFYKIFFSPFLGGACKFYPSCSNYAQEAIELHGARRGGWLALKRLGRCRPFTKGGFDPVPDAEDLDAAWLRSERVPLDAAVREARSARSEGNVRPGPRNYLRSRFAADSFRLGTFLQAAGSSAADRIQSQTSAPVSQQGGAAGLPRSREQPGRARIVRRQRAKSGLGPQQRRIRSVVEASEEKTVVVQSPLYRVELSNRGGVVKTWQLNKYMDDQKPPQPLDLVNDSVAQELGWPFSLVLADPQLEAKANSGLYEIETHAIPSCSCPQVRS